jgi:spore germination protein KC
MRRRLLLAAAVVLLLSGCWSRIEVNDLAIVDIIAMDREENGNWRISLQIVTPQRIAQPGGQGGQAGSRRPFLVVSDTGPTALDAIRKLQLQLPRRIFLAHANVILVGEALAR